MIRPTIEEAKRAGPFGKRGGYLMATSYASVPRVQAAEQKGA